MSRSYSTGSRGGDRVRSDRGQPIVRASGGSEERAVIQRVVNQPLAVAERAIHRASTENVAIYKDGKQIAVSNGSGREVIFTKEELKLMKGSVLTHNHPQGTSFSRADLQLIKQRKLEEIRAVANYDDTTYSIKPPKDSLLWKTSVAKLASDHEKMRRAVYENAGYLKEYDAREKACVAWYRKNKEWPSPEQVPDRIPSEVHRTAINDSIEALDIKYKLGYTKTPIQ